jgi:YidC/Oxa1 family membrane protein insertase
MESQRSFLFIALMVVTYLLFTEYQKENAPVIAQPITSQTINKATSNDGDFIPESTNSESVAIRTTEPNAKIITVKTDVLSLKINTQGGDIIEAKLLKFDTEQGNGIPFTVMQNGARKYIAQSGLTGAQGLDRIIPGRPIYKVDSSSYQLNNDQPLTVDLTYTTDDGLSVIKRFTFNKTSYSVNVEYIINN